jgi:hypothetical protein
MGLDELMEESRKAEEEYRRLKALFGNPRKIQLKENGDINVIFNNGDTITLGYPYKWGYYGTGPTLFRGFLKDAGFKVSEKQLAQMKAPFVLTRELGEPKERGISKTRQESGTRWEWKSGFVKIEAFDEAEARKAARAQIPNTASITGIQITQKGTKGFLGIGRKPCVYQIRYKLPVETRKAEAKPRQPARSSIRTQSYPAFNQDFDEFEDSLAKIFHPKSQQRTKYKTLLMKTEELVEFYSHYANHLDCFWSIESNPMSQDVLYVTFFEKGKIEENLEFIGMFEFNDRSALEECLRYDAMKRTDLPLKGMFLNCFIGCCGNVMEDFNAECIASGKMIQVTPEGLKKVFQKRLAGELGQETLEEILGLETPDLEKKRDAVTGEKLPPTQVHRDLCLSLFIFNSDKISSEISVTSYGGYAERELLKALSRALKEHGGWDALPPLVQACHGDLFERSILGKDPSIDIMTKWLERKAYGINSEHLDENMVGRLKSGRKLGYIPYVVGMHPLPKSFAVATHRELMSRNVVGYLGLVTLHEVTSFVDVAHAISLPLEMEIKAKKLNGDWLARHVSSKDYGDACLES